MSAPSPKRTTWILEPSEAYDAICFVNLLRGDPFYLDRGYRAEIEPWIAGLGARERAALRSLERNMEGNVIPGALTLVFSAVSPRTLADLRATTGDDARWDALRRAFLATPFGSEGSFAPVARSRADLDVLFAHIDARGFAAAWSRTVLPRVEKSIAEGRAAIERFDVVGEDERVLGRRLPVTSLTAYVLGYVRPHGVRITGWRFLTDATYPVDVTVKTALHELLHPPFLPDSVARPVLAQWEKDAFLVRLTREHDPRLGYTEPAGLVEEDFDTAVHVWSAHRLGLLPDATAYFRDHDDGIHVLAFLIYRRLMRADFRAWTTYDRFVVDLARTGALAPGRLEAAFCAERDRYPLAIAACPAR